MPADAVRRLQRVLGRELPSCTFADEVVEHLAVVLDESDALSEETLCQAWFPFLIDAEACEDEETARALCGRLLPGLLPGLHGEEEDFTDLDEWLGRVHLDDYAQRAHKWCRWRGRVPLASELSSQEFADALGLKSLERRRIVRDAEGSFGRPDDLIRYTILEEIEAGVPSRGHICAKRGQRFATKTISLKRLNMETDFRRISGKLHAETSILLELQHPRILNLHDAIEDPGITLRLVTEFSDGGNLSQKVDHMGSFSEALSARVFLQIVDGLKYMHRRGIVHRNLRPDNILVVSKDTDPLQVKLSDFGHLGLCLEIEHRPLRPELWPPEVSAYFGLWRAAQTVDLWSLGVVLYAMLIGAYPGRSHLADPAALDAPVCHLADMEIRRDSFTSRHSGLKVSHRAQDLICSLIRLDPNQRLSLDRCLSHIWVTTNGVALKHEAKLLNAAL